MIWLASAACYAGQEEAYILHCGGCHLPDGRGVEPEVPTLVNELGKLIQLPGGRDYIIRVPGASQAPISDQQLADILNYILVEFNENTLADNFKPLSGAEVAIARPNILADPFKHRDELWSQYKP